MAEVDPNTGLSVSPGPKLVRVQGMGESEEFSISDQIALDKYNRANAAATSRSSFFGIRRCKFIPTGAVYPTCNSSRNLG